jgi:hypothetical protein
MTLEEGGIRTRQTMHGSNKNRYLWAASLLALVMAACDKPYTWDGSLEALMASQPGDFAAVLEDPGRYRVQIIYTQIDRDADNRPSFRSYTYRLDAGEYFYPASTVKLPTAVLALEKLGDLGIDDLDRNIVVLSGDAESGKSIGRYVREILLVSDNDAFNRLYEFLGQEALNERMRRSGFDGTRIMHRLEVALSVDENRRTGPIRLVDGKTVVHEQEAVYSGIDYTAPEPIPLGNAEVVGDELLERPKDFASKNAFPLQAQHDVIKALMFPEAVDERMRFRLSEDDYAFLYRNLSGYPGESGIAEYSDAERYPDGYVKFLMFGGDALAIPDNIRIFNKVGDAYGFLTDAAYIVDFENGIEFILAATIYTNANRTFNDDIYEYDEIGMPFMRHLGQAIYDVELRRKRSHAPDLSGLEFVRH